MREALEADDAVGALADHLDAALEKGRHVLVLGNALLGRHGEDAALAVVDERRPLRGVAQEVDLLAEQGLHPLRAALVGDVRELRAGHLLDLDHGELAGAADAGGAVVVLLRFLLAGSDQFLERLPRGVGLDHDAHRVARQAADVGEVLERVPVGLLVVRVAQAVDAHAGQRRAIGLGVQQHGRGQRAGRTGLDVDQDLLAQDLRHGLAQHADVDVGDAARGERVVDGDGAVGLPLGLATRHHRRGEKGGAGQAGQSTTLQHDSSSQNLYFCPIQVRDGGVKPPRDAAGASGFRQAVASGDHAFVSNRSPSPCRLL